MSNVTNNNKWKLKIWSYDHGLLDNFVKSLQSICKSSMIKMIAVFIPTKNKRFTLLKSAFIYSKSKIHIEMNIHKRSIILDLGTRSMDVFRDLNVPQGVSIELKPLVSKKNINTNNRSQG